MKIALRIAALLLLAAFAFAQTDSVTLTWSAGSGGGAVASFNVLRGATSGGESTTPINSTPIAFVSGQASYSYVDSAVIEGSTYFYEIQAVGPTAGGIALTAVSPETSATIPFLAPAAPTKPTVVVR